MKLTIVTRRSRLALKQTEIVKQLLLAQQPALQIEILPVSTKGDEILDQSLVKIGGKGLFVKELEQYLLDNLADIAVHSLKDMPAQLPSGLALGAILPRADARDVLVSNKFASLAALPVGAKVGTSSLRRQAQLLALRPDLQTVTLRGNVETRIDKLLNAEYDAIILAAAGLVRLELQEWLTQPLAITQMLPAVGQGALAIEYKQQRLEIAHLIAELHDANTAACVQAERALNAKLDGGCQAPIAGFAQIHNNKLHLQALVATPDGTTVLRAQDVGDLDTATILGANVADQLIQQGAVQIIAAAKKLWA